MSFSSIIDKHLEKKAPEKRKTMTLSIREDQIHLLDRVARTLTKQSDQLTSRTMLIEDAIEEFLSQTVQILEERGIPLEPTLTAEIDHEFDTIVVPGKPDGFDQVFLNEQKWYYLRLDKNKIPKIRYVAIYISKPESRITHYAKVAEHGFVLDEKTGKYVVSFSEPAIQLEHPVVLGSTPSRATITPCYTTLERLISAKEYRDL